MLNFRALLILLGCQLTHVCHSTRLFNVANCRVVAERHRVTIGLPLSSSRERSGVAIRAPLNLDERASQAELASLDLHTLLVIVRVVLGAHVHARLLRLLRRDHTFRRMHAHAVVLETRGQVCPATVRVVRDYCVVYSRLRYLKHYWRSLLLFALLVECLVAAFVAENVEKLSRAPLAA